jgi:poly(beta-D-mannuronate) C5 epimerase
MTASFTVIAAVFATALAVHAQDDGPDILSGPEVPLPALPEANTAPSHDGDELSEPLDVDPEDPGERDQSDGSAQDNPATEQNNQFVLAKNYVVSRGASAPLRMNPPTLPNLSPYTAEAVMAKIGRKPAGHALVESMLDKLAFKAFMGRNERMREWALRQTSMPKVIVVRGGYMTARDIARQVPREYFEETAKGVFVARLPISVEPGATLHLDQGVKDFRLSLERGSFLVNEGKLFMTGARLRAWSENRNQPATFKGEREFRPFLLSWAGSHTYITNSVVAHLGYMASKSYGISISQFSPGLKNRMNRPSPKGWLINSEFYDNWYGFYCYEADELIIRGNKYHDNITYGIDPHDRSERLIIAENIVSKTKKKHGIIVSREVNNSWIFSNKTYDNGLAGIVIDRNSLNNVVAQNQVFRNNSDGITIYESPKTLIWQNLVSGNRRHGIRVRNSTDLRLYGNIAVGNSLAGIYGNIKDLTGTGRNVRLDPFHEKISMTVVGGQLVSNGSGPISIDQPLSLELYDVDLRAPQRQLGIKFTGILGQYQEQVLDILMRQKGAVVVKPTTSKPIPVSSVDH